MKRIRAGLLACLIAAAAAYAPAARAIPALQIYSPDATYDSILETWVINDDTFELWVIGAVGDYGPIMDVTLAASYYGTSGSIEFLPGLAPDTDYENKEGFKNGVKNHAEFANADGHLFYDIGDFTSTSDTIQDYQPGAPAGTKQGEIKSFMVHVTGYDMVHFDAFDHYFTGKVGTASYRMHGVFAPFSHDGTGGGENELPAPGTLLLLIPGLAGLVVYRRKR